MSNRLIILQRAEIHITEAFKWYENKQSDLGNDFLVSIENSLTIIEHNPDAFQLKYKHIRAVYIKQFPFGIFYIIEKEKIIVIAVFHLSRNPKLWKKLK
ncbi:MAG: type II toxin-antitoxin system RelE/ParE family toxin [Bacteroidetes bacterium]|nr:type II toxin-antitoxin system RelE/ParE family toxin [Bacteroidota bacterium]